jgi:hypothetical protein
MYIVTLKFLKDPNTDNLFLKILGAIFNKKDIAELIRTFY